MEKQQAELEISAIKQIMEDSRKIVATDGRAYIIWGILVVIGILGTYMLIHQTLFGYIGWLWITAIGLGWIYTFISNLRKTAQNHVHTFAGKILGAVWVSCGIAMTLIGFAGTATGAIGGYTISPMMSIVLGVAYFVTGIVYGLPWVRNLSIGWWIGALVTFIWTGRNSLLVFALMMTAFQIIPGIILYSKFKKQYRAGTNG